MAAPLPPLLDGKHTHPADPGNHGGGPDPRVPHGGGHQLRHPHPQHRERRRNAETEVKQIVTKSHRDVVISISHSLRYNKNTCQPVKDDLSMTPKHLLPRVRVSYKAG